MARRRIAGVLAAATLAAASSAAAEPSLDALMDRLAGSPGLRTGFVEVRTLPLLAEPIESHGHIAVVPPDRFARTTETPSATRLVLDGDELRVEGQAGPGDLTEPAARRVAEELRAIFAGDLATLRERYELDFQARDGSWVLALVPRSAGARRFVERLALRGRGTGLVSLELQEPGGGHAITRLHGLETDRPLSAEERARFFGADPSP